MSSRMNSLRKLFEPQSIALVGVSRHPENQISEMDINPLVVTGSDVKAVDALIALSPGKAV